MNKTVRLTPLLGVVVGLVTNWTVVNSLADTIYVANQNGGVVQFAPNGAGSNFGNTALLDVPEGLAFDSSGDLFVANAYNNSIVEFTPGGLGSVFASSGLDNPLGLAIDSAGNVYVANYGNNTIEKFTPAGIGSVFTNTDLSGPNDLAFDSAGNLYVGNTGNNTIAKFTQGGVGSVFASTGLNGPYGLAFDGKGNLFVVNSVSPGNNNITEFTPGGVASVFANSLPGADGFGLEAHGLAFDSAGNLFVATTGPFLMDMFTPDGVGSVVADYNGSAGDINSGELAINPGLVAGIASSVPLPSAVYSGLAMLGMLGLGRLSLVIKRRQHSHRQISRRRIAWPRMKVSPRGGDVRMPQRLLH